MKFLLLTLLLTLLSCSSGPSVAGGSSSETTSGIVVITSAGSISGKAQAGSELILLDSDYHPLYNSGRIDTVTTSKNERFTFDSLESSTYNLYARDTATGTGVFINGITTGGAISSITAAYQSPGRLEGQIKNEFMVNEESVVLMGSPFTATIEQNGNFTFTQIPVGSYQLWIPLENIVDTGLDTEGSESTYTITVISDSTTTWKE